MYPNRKPFAIRTLNGVGHKLMQMGLKIPGLNPELLIQSARRKTGVDDFGHESFRPALYRLTESLQQEAQLSTLGRIIARTQLLEALQNRLGIIDWRKKHPEVADMPVSRPLLILGLPRTGSTILYEILAQDPVHRTPISWEVQRPLPPPRQGDFENDPRIAQVQKGMDQLDILSPDFKAIHEIGARLPQECLVIMASAFCSEYWGASFLLHDYRLWMMAQDMTPVYDWHYQFLQHLQSRFARERWLLKTPGHLPFPDYVLARYPDAAIVQTHRDPMDVMGSVSSLAYSIRSVTSESVDLRITGKTETDYWSRVLQRGIETRDAHDRPEQFYDVYFKDILADPLGTIEGIYSHFGFPLKDDVRRNMETYLENKPRSKYGKHKYSLAQFGLTESLVRERFAAYYDRFNV
ncbi:MAG: sulfotransferase [Deltaproteobacteria bacterium]|nr:sulfotransferase [Deltaproteobacteria bacterium]